MTKSNSVFKYIMESDREGVTWMGKLKASGDTNNENFLKGMGLLSDNNSRFFQFVKWGRVSAEPSLRSH